MTAPTTSERGPDGQRPLTQADLLAASVANDATHHAERKSDWDHQRVADIYNGAVAAGHPRPVVAVREALGVDQYGHPLTKADHTRIRSVVANARRRGLIPATRKDGQIDG